MKTINFFVASIIISFFPIILNLCTNEEFLGGKFIDTISGLIAKDFLEPVQGYQWYFGYFGNYLPAQQEKVEEFFSWTWTKNRVAINPNF